MGWRLLSGDCRLRPQQPEEAMVVLPREGRRRPANRSMSEQEASRPNSTQTLATPAPARPRTVDPPRHEAVPSPKATLEGLRASHHEAARGRRQPEPARAVDAEQPRAGEGSMPSLGIRSEPSILPREDSGAGHASLQEDLSLRLGGMRRAHLPAPVVSTSKPAAHRVEKRQPATQGARRRTAAAQDWSRARSSFPDWAPWAGLALVLVLVLALVLSAKP